MSPVAMPEKASCATRGDVRLRPIATFDIADVRMRVRAQLADYKVPKHVEIQRDLSREDSGKIFKRRLRDPYWERARRRI